MGEGIGKASKATIYLESILSPSQAEKSLTALVIWYKTLRMLLENTQVSFLEEWSCSALVSD